MDKIAKSGDLHGEKDENVQCMGDCKLRGYPYTYSKNALQRNIDDGKLLRVILAAG